MATSTRCSSSCAIAKTVGGPLSGDSRRRFVAGAGLLLLSPLLPASVRAGTDQASAEEFIDGLANQVLDIVKNGDRLIKKRDAFHAMLVANADIPAIAMFSLGRYARRLPERDRIDYYGLVAAYISHIFVTHAVSLGGDRVHVTGSMRRGDRELLVTSKVRFTNGNSLPVTWRVIRDGNKFKVFDVSVNGIWLAIQQRSEFVSVIKRGGGDVETLLEFLRGRS